MSELPFRDGKHFSSAHLMRSALPGLLAAAVDVLYLNAVMQLGAEQWKAFLYSVALAAVVLTPFGRLAAGRMERAIVQALDAQREGTATHEQLVAGYAAATKLPLHGMLWYFSNWVVAAAIVPPAMVWMLGSLSRFATISIIVAALTGGLAVAPFVYYALRSLVQPLREFWSPGLSAEERAEHALEIPLQHKVRFPVTAVSASTVVLLCLLAYSLASRPVELQDVRVKDAFLDFAAQELVDHERAEAVRSRELATLEASQEVEGGEAPLRADAVPQGESMAELTHRARSFAAAHQLLLIDSTDGIVRAGSSTLLGHELGEVLASPDRGNSAALDSDHSFAWKALPDGSGRVLIAATPGSAFSESLNGALLLFAVVLVASLCFGFGTTHLLVGDITGTSRRIQEQAASIADGDLSSEEVIESEDELGDLARTFARMKVSLRETVMGMAAAANRVEGAASGLAEIGGGVAAISQEQVKGIEQATARVAGIDRNVSQITESSHGLSGYVEEASSSVLELGAAGEQLHSTAQALNQQVGDVTTSIEQMVRSVNGVGEHTESLTDAVSETSSSMSEMTRSMREVEGHANESAKLSSHVIDVAESGRAQVQQTIQGMADIRDATEAADEVIRGLTGRMSEIGAIVDVIDDVADETNLLALNAAIIAAQSGEQGRAFSVVADEIKDLADRVLSSTKEIGSLISSVQAESAAAARAIARGNERVQGGVDLSAQAGVALEEITAAARDSGGRIQEIVAAVREQARAAGHVEQLMEGVSARVEEIRSAGLEQQRGNEVVMRGASVMSEVAQQTQRTTEEQSSGAGRIRDSMENVRDAVEHIHHALQEQGEACTAALSFLQSVFQSTRSNDESAEQLREAALTMQRQAESLREHVSRFRVE